MKIWYMRDNHTFLSLPPDVDAAMVELRRAFIDKRDTYGSLCCREGPMRNKMEHAHADWLEFEPRARKWIEAALKPTDAEIEYTSWLTSNGPCEPGVRFGSEERKTMDNDPTNAAGPAHLAPRPAPGLQFDARGVLIPIELDPWARLRKLANEYAMHLTDAAMHQAESRADISRAAALKTLKQMREVFFAHCREVEQGTRHACSIAVWMTLQDALQPDADDKGLDGWMREAEQRVKLGPNVK